MRCAAILACLMAGAVDLHPEGPDSTASRTTSLSKRITIGSQSPLVSESQVYSWLQRWQARLGLQDWKIEAKVVRARDLPKGTVANIHWSISKKQATIKVLHSADSPLERAEFIKDTELSVVHELIHLSMAKLPLDAVNTDLEEDAVKKISTALVNLQKDEAQPRTVEARR